jgi:hypothetical protein
MTQARKNKIDAGEKKGSTQKRPALYYYIMSI